MKNRTIAVDLAKNVFEIGISTRPGQVDKTCRLSRAKFLEFFAKQEPATVVMEACDSAHHWARQFQKLGHEVVLISPQYVTPYVVRNKTDRADVKGILEAYRNSEIHPVPIKTIAQQQLTALHRIRSTWIQSRTKRINMVRGLLREFGFVIPMGARNSVRALMGCQPLYSFPVPLGRGLQRPVLPRAECEASLWRVRRRSRGAVISDSADA